MNKPTVKLMEKATIKRGDLFAITQALNYLSNQNTEAWYPVSRNISFTEKPLEALYKSKEEMFNRLGEKDEKGKLMYTDASKKTVKFAEGKKEEADKVWEEIQDEEIEIKVYKFSYTRFGNAKLNAQVIKPLLDLMITE